MKVIQLRMLQCLCVIVYGQLKPPGGVAAPAYWYVTSEDANHPALRKIAGPDTASLLLPGTATRMRYLNYRPAIQFAAGDRLQLNTISGNFHQASFFTVYQTTDSLDENIIWHTSNKGKPGLVLTTSRMADLTEYRYMNYIDVAPMAPKVNAIVQHDTIFSAFTNIHFGNKPDTPNLPVSPFKGLLPEFVVYDRALSGEDFLKVNSYLCLKYGITLTEPEATYLNSAGQTIWSGNDYASFHHNIAGLVRDDAAGLDQKIASSSHEPGMLAVSTRDSIADLCSLLWGDNAQPFTYVAKTAGQPTPLARQGIMVFTGNADSINTTVQFDTRQVDIDKPIKPVYWLAIDRSGQGDFNNETVEYHRMDRMAGTVAIFNNIVWKKKKTDKEKFTLVPAGNLLLSTHFTAPSCSHPASGSFRITPWGAKYPCHIRVTSNQHTIFTATLQAASPIVVDGLTAGKYGITITDALQQTGIDSFYLNNADGPQTPQLQDTYFIHEGQNLELNAAAGMPTGISYTWQGPGLATVHTPRISLARAGIYRLTSEQNGCTFVREIEVRNHPRNAITNIVVYPNPSSGTFEVRVSLDKTSPVTMTIFTEDGRLVAQKQLKGQANYTFSHHLSTSGLYHLIFNAGLDKATKEVLIVQ